MYWLEVSVATDGEGAEAVADVLQPYAHGGSVVMEQLGDEHDPDPAALESAVTVKIYVPGDRDSPDLRRRLEEMVYHLGRMYPIPAPTFRELIEEDWANAWKLHYQPFRIGEHIWIQPSWVEKGLNRGGRGSSPQDDVILVLDPGMAFGTGTHPTTQMCLTILEKLVTAGDRLLDVGTGSGILAIAGAKLGAARLVCIDTDEMAVKTATENLDMNEVGDRAVVWQGSLESVEEREWDVIVVNILAPVIVSLLEKDHLMDYVADSGNLILSGIIQDQAPMVEAAVLHAGGKIAQRISRGDWMALVARPRTSPGEHTTSP